MDCFGERFLVVASVEGFVAVGFFVFVGVEMDGDDGGAFVLSDICGALCEIQTVGFLIGDDKRFDIVRFQHESERECVVVGDGGFFVSVVLDLTYCARVVCIAFVSVSRFNCDSHKKVIE